MGYLYNNDTSKTSSNNYDKYDNWIGASPNLSTFITAVNHSNPILGCQYEMVYSRWPRTIFFAKSVTIPGVATNYYEIYHAGFAINISANPKYDATEITFSILADKEGLHYYDWRNMVLQGGHPLVAGFPKATIGNQDYSSTEDTIEVRLRNDPKDDNLSHHHWVIHNFRPVTVGDLELSQDNESFVEFEVTGTFTHIDYDCGHSTVSNNSSDSSNSSDNQDDFEDPLADLFNEEENTDTSELDELFEEEDDVALQEEMAEELEATEEMLEEDEENAEEEEEEEEDDVPDDYGDLDPDEQAAVDMLQDYGEDDPTVQNQLEEQLQKQYPNEDPELIQTRAEFAMDTARKFNKKQSQ